MRFGIGIPQRVGAGGFDPDRFSRTLMRAEELGFASAWVQEQLLGPAPLLSPLPALCAAAMCTRQIRLGCAVLVTPLHSPIHLARELASVDQLSRGRLEVGVVAGGPGRPYAAFGLSPQGAISRFNEGLRILMALWSEPEVSFEGRFFRLEHASVGLKPYQRPHPPIWFGGNHPDALRRAVRFGQGFIGAGSQPTDRFAEQVRIVRRLLEEVEKPDFRIAKRVYIAVDDDLRQAKARLAAAFAELYPRLAPEDALAFSVAGTPDDCAEGLRAIAQAGAQLIVLTPLFDEREQMERLSAEVLGQLGDL
jgi:alkanesulfonate monooxygenase SsuD/methylene tetrahydromethanopterin reductase-like flavin-dependent oxidoreductase (luciferase family)